MLLPSDVGDPPPVYSEQESQVTRTRLTVSVTWEPPPSYDIALVATPSGGYPSSAAHAHNTAMIQPPAYSEQVTSPSQAEPQEPNYNQNGESLSSRNQVPDVEESQNCSEATENCSNMEESSL